jgi:hypothetical protein
MQSKGLLIAVVVLAVVGGGLWYSNRSEKSKEGKEDTERPTILKIATDQFKSIEIKRTSGENTRLERGTGGEWKITSPVEYSVDHDAVTGLVTLLSNLASAKVVDQTVSDMAAYGLKPPSMEIVVATKDGKTQRLLVGDQAPAGEHFFAMKAGDPRLFGLASVNQTGLDKKAADLRDKRLLTFDVEKLARLNLRVNNQDLEFGKNGQNEWQIVKPSSMRADGFQVEDLIRKMRDAKLDPSLTEEDQKQYAAAFAKAQPVAIASATGSSGTQTLTIRKSGEDYYASSSAVSGTYKIAKETADAFGKKLDVFRQTKLFDFGWEEVSKVDFSDGGTSLNLLKKGEKWMSGATEMDSISVQNLVDRLRDITASGFATAGFTTPKIQMSVVSNQGRRTEKVLISQTGDKYFARRENEPSTYELPKSTVEAMLQAVKDVRQAKVEKKQGAGKAGK